MKVTQITPARFHHFHLARQMQKHDLLNAIYTGYPMFKLKDEGGIPVEKIKTFPWIQVPFLARGLLGLDKFETLNKNWIWLAAQTLDKYVASQINDKGILIALSSKGLHAGRKMQALGGKDICDRGSSHIVYQNEILDEEYKRWGFQWKGTDTRIIAKELKEYDQADFITVPSEFVRNSFIEKGIDSNKIIKIPYGARLDRFQKLGEPDKNKFSVLWVGGVSLRKGFMYALRAFNDLKHPNKEFIVVGHLSEEINVLLEKENLKDIHFKGTVPNTELLKFYSYADVFLLTSLEEGLAMVQGEALACGCPIISTTNTGAEDLIEDGVEGFIIPIRDTNAILASFQKLLDNPTKRQEMSNNALNRVNRLGGWDTYGNNFKSLIQTFK